MRILIAAPMLPPETGEPADYARRFAAREASRHDVTVVAYAHLPEPIPDTRMIVIEKQHPLPIRLARFFFVLLRESRRADAIYAEHVATALPALFVGFIRRIPVCVRFRASEAWERARRAGATAQDQSGYFSHPEGSFKTRLVHVLEQFTLRHAALVLASSRETGGLLTRHNLVSHGRLHIYDDPHQLSVAYPTREPGQRSVPRANKSFLSSLRARLQVREKHPSTIIERARYIAQELPRAEKIATSLGFALDDEQLHLKGERAVFGTHKLVLFGKRMSDGMAVVIKMSSDREGRQEIEREHACRIALDRIGFAYGALHSPEEIFFKNGGSYTIAVTRLIHQDSPFLKRPLEEQYALARKVLEAQEGVHAVTYEHIRSIKGEFEIFYARDYRARAEQYRRAIKKNLPKNASAALLDRAIAELSPGSEIVERYCGFLTHYDLMPQNIRVADGTVYLLDHASLRFGNKYEGWARWINFMVLYNPALAEMLERHVRETRPEGEWEALRLMRTFRLLELIAHHADIAAKIEGGLRTLSMARTEFWSRVLEAVLDKKNVPQGVIDGYTQLRDGLRSEEEKNRQRGLH